MRINYEGECSEVYGKYYIEGPKDIIDIVRRFYNAYPQTNLSRLKYDPYDDEVTLYLEDIEERLTKEFDKNDYFIGRRW